HARAVAANSRQADDVRVGHGPDRRRSPALRHQVLPRRDHVPRVRRRASLSLSVGRRRVSGRRLSGPAHREARRLRRRADLRRPSPRRVSLRLEEGSVPMALDLPESVMLTSLDKIANWVRSNSLWPMPFATACCGIELMATGASKHDIARFGAEVMRF